MGADRFAAALGRGGAALDSLGFDAAHAAAAGPDSGGEIRPRLVQAQHSHLHRGDVVVFAPPQALVDAGYDSKAALIKRVVGLPGDQLVVEQGQLIRNGQRVQEPWLSEEMDYAMNPVTVPEQHLWVMGDNRNASLDSHLWGPLPETKVIGTAVWRYWPLQRFGPIRISATEADGLN